MEDLKVDYVEEIKKIEKDSEEKRTEKIRLEEKLKNLKEKKEELREELKGLGIKEEDLEQWIIDKKSEIEKGIEQCRKILKGE